MHVLERNLVLDVYANGERFLPQNLLPQPLPRRRQFQQQVYITISSFKAACFLCNSSQGNDEA